MCFKIFVFKWKIVECRFLTVTCFPFWDMHILDMQIVCLQTYRNNRICEKVANSRNFRITIRIRIFSVVVLYEHKILKSALVSL